MDILKQLGEIALGSRLKRLSDQIMKGGAEIYKANNIAFEPKWFPVYYLLTQKDNLGIMEIAAEIGVKHPTVSQTVKELEKIGYLKSAVAAHDARKRIVILTNKGLELLPKIEMIWKDISNVLHELNKNHSQNILCALDDFEVDFQEKDMIDRVHEKTKNRLISEVEILDFNPAYAKDFKKLNEEWINKFFTLEKEDIHVLNNPIKAIIKPGGAVLLAKIKDKIVGTCALISHQNGEFELAKMAVIDKYQGRQIGKKLGLATLEKARKLKAKKVFLESNKKLTPALNLYEKLGFKISRNASKESVYERCNICMEIEIN
jgi:DNA-binding MarR family transcriptional regulator